MGRLKKRGYNLCEKGRPLCCSFSGTNPIESRDGCTCVKGADAMTGVEGGDDNILKLVSVCLLFHSLC